MNNGRLFYRRQKSLDRLIFICYTAIVLHRTSFTGVTLRPELVHCRTLTVYLSGAIECHAYRFALIVSRLSFRAYRFALIVSRLSFRAYRFALTSGLAFLLACASSCLADVIPWDANAQGQFITSLCPGTRGTVWIGTEDQGVWQYNPAAPAGKQFAHYTQIDGLGDDNAYALVCDKAGRLWAGTLSHGVSVFNGKQWRTYGPLDGPLGSRVFALAVNPKDGGVWGATEAGLFRYENSRWTYFTREGGLPSDQANALAFDTDGTLYVGTQCDGIAIASPSDGYKSWRVVSGPASLPNAPSGTGLPSALINCLLVTKSGTVYAGTDGGLAGSRDGGETWQYVRGLDWKAKLTGLLPPVTPLPVTVSSDLLSEDYVTALVEGADGRIFVGHRQTGLEAFNPKTGQRVQSGMNGSKTDSDLSCLLLSGQTAWVGLYGGGVLPPESVASNFSASSLSIAPLPAPAKPPTPAELNTLLKRTKPLQAAIPIGGAAYLGEDWQTQGDWVGRYGRQYAVMCATASPRNYCVIHSDHNYALRTRQYRSITDSPYSVYAETGPNAAPDEGLRHWIEWMTTDNPRTLYNPLIGFRREAEWDDHGETYPMMQDGPDIWITVQVPTGFHRLSLYFFNKDGHDNSNRYRDYLVEIKPASASLALAQDAPDLAKARVKDFWGGVYQKFALRGPSKYLVRVSRNHSFNTLVCGVFLDQSPSPFFGSKTLSAQRSYQMLSYRAAVQEGKPADVLAKLRAALPFWAADDRKTFHAAMSRSWAKRLATHYTADHPFVTIISLTDDK